MKKLLFLLALVVMPAVALAGYDTQTKRPDQIDTMTVDEVASTDYMYVVRTGTGDAEKVAMVNLANPVEVVTAANTLTTAECGKKIILSTTAHAETLPTPTAGCSFDFIVGTLAQGFTVVTTGAESIVGIGYESETDDTEDGPTTTGADTITFVSGSTHLGDRANLVSDGTSWYVITFTSGDGGVTFTSAI